MYVIFMKTGNARANTMFKLTYQAYIMFGMTMIYAIFRLLIIGKNKILKALAVIGLFSLYGLWLFRKQCTAWLR